MLVLTFPLSLTLLLLGALIHRASGRTPDFAYRSLVRLYLLTNGVSNEWWSAVIRWFRPPYTLPDQPGVLGRLTPSDITNIVDDVRRKAWCILPSRLPDDIVSRLTEFARTTPCTPRSASGGEPVLFDAAHPTAPTYHFSAESLLANVDIQRLIADPGLLAIVQEYLGCRPILDTVTMWWSVPFAPEPSVASGQLYHFDMDRIKYVRAFVLLTEVTTSSGPHCMVTGSHRTGRKPLELRLRGYARLSDEDIDRYYSKAEQAEHCGPPGTILLNDASAFHKGKVPQTGTRLILELGFANSLFGSAFDCFRMSAPRDAAFIALGQRYPDVLAKLDRRGWSTEAG